MYYLCHSGTQQLQSGLRHSCGEHCKHRKVWILLLGDHGLKPLSCKYLCTLVSVICSWLLLCWYWYATPLIINLSDIYSSPAEFARHAIIHIRAGRTEFFLSLRLNPPDALKMFTVQKSNTFFEVHQF